MILLGALSALLIASLLAAATCAWLLAGRAVRWPLGPRRGLSPEAALRRHPASQARFLDPAGLFPLDDDDVPAQRPVGPDDDPEFMSALDRLIHGDDYDGR